MNFLSVVLSVILVGCCDGIVDSIIAQRLLTRDEGRLLQALNETYHESQGKGFAESYIMDVVLNLIMAQKDNFPTAISNSVSSQCKNDSELYVYQLLYQSMAPGRNSWALRMFESGNQSPQGLHQPILNNKQAYGHFDECLAIRAQNKKTLTNFRGKYCTVYFHPVVAVLDNTSRNANNWLTMIEDWQLIKVANSVPQVADTTYVDSVVSRSSGYCLPSSCTGADVRQAVADLVGVFAIADERNGTFVSIETATGDNQCYVESDEAADFDGASYGVLAVLVLIGLLVVAATIHECVRIYLDRTVDDEDSFAVRCLHCFSALNNSRKMLDMKQQSDGFSSLNAIRFLTAVWLVFDHSVLAITERNVTMGATYEDSKACYNIPLSANVSVDTFFVLGGMLVSYTLLRQLERNKGKLNMASEFLHRYLRLTPTYAFILAIMSSVIVYCGDGPYWDNVRTMSDKCRANWWTNMLYINNLVRYEPHAFSFNSVCMKETWFLACDMQYYLISPLLVYPIWRWRFWGLVPLVALTSASLLANVIVFASNDILMMASPKSFFPFNERSDLVNYISLAYAQPWLRVAPYFVGMLLGWAVHETKKTDLKLSQKMVAVLWISACVTCAAILFGMYPYFNEIREPGKLEIIAYGSFHRTMWALALSWIIYACAFGYAGIVNDILSWKAFIPLARLNYCVYLINLNYITFYISRSRVPFYYTLLGLFHYGTGMIVMVYMLAFATSLAVEVPFLNLEKVIFPRGETTNRPNGIEKSLRDPGVTENNKNEEISSTYSEKKRQ